MKRACPSLLIVLALAGPVAALAQTSNDSATRADAHAGTVATEQNGTLYPSKIHYPLQPVAQTDNSGVNSAYGAPISGSMMSGYPMTAQVAQPGLYAHH